MTICIDNTHFGHQPFVRHIGPAAGDFRVVKRDVRQPLLTIPPWQLAHLGRTDFAVAVENHDVGVRSLGGWCQGGVVVHQESRFG